MTSFAPPDRGVLHSLLRLRAAQKSSRGAPLYSLYVNRPVGRVLAAVAHRFGLRPNQVTALSAIFTFAAIAALAFLPATVFTGSLIAFSLMFGYALDSADGQLARLSGCSSTRGEWLDHVIDAGKNSALHLAVLVTFFRHFDLPSWQLLIPILFSLVAAVHFFGVILNEQLKLVKRLQAGLGSTRPRSTSPRWVSVTVLPIDYGVLCIVFVVLGAHSVFLFLYGVLMLANVGHLLLILPKWFRDMGRLDQETGRLGATR